MMSCGWIYVIRSRLPSSGYTFISNIPAIRLPILHLIFLIRVMSYLLTQESIGSPPGKYTDKHGCLAPGCSICFLTQTETYVLLSARKKTSTYGYVDFGAQSLSALFPNCLLIRIHRYSCIPKTLLPVVRLHLLMRFPLINLCLWA